MDPRPTIHVRWAFLEWSFPDDDAGISHGLIGYVLKAITNHHFERSPLSRYQHLS